jgi:hypothetical protein
VQADHPRVEFGQHRDAADHALAGDGQAGGERQDDQ